MTYLTELFLFLPKNFPYEAIMVDTNRKIKLPDIFFGEFLQLSSIVMLMTANPGTDRVEYFSENPIYIFSGCSIRVNKFISGNIFGKFALMPSSLPPLPLSFEINYIKPGILLLRGMDTCKKYSFHIGYHV